MNVSDHLLGSIHLLNRAQDNPSFVPSVSSNPSFVLSVSSNISLVLDVSSTISAAADVDVGSSISSVLHMRSNISVADASHCSDGVSLSNTTSQDNASLPYIPMSVRPERFIVPIVFAIILIVGLVGNGALVFFFIKYIQLRSVPNTYIMSLAVGDVLVLVFTVPFVSLVFTLESFPFGEHICRVQEFMGDLSVGVTVFTLTVLSVTRYHAIVQPYSKRSESRTTARCIIVLIWLGSIVFALPALILTNLRHFEKSNSEEYIVCYPFPEYLGEIYPKYVVLFKFLTFYCIPLAIIATFYVMMAIHLLKQSIPGELAAQTRNLQRHVASRRKVANMVLVFVLVFAVCFFPNNVFMMWFYFHATALDDYNYVWNATRITGFCLKFLNSCINPIALYWISGTFRHHFNRHIFRCLITSSHHHHHHVASLSTTAAGMHYHSSTKTGTTRTDQFEMSTTNGPDKLMINNAESSLRILASKEQN